MKRRPHKSTLAKVLVTIGATLGFAPLAGAQHYPAGAEGIKPATLPTDGISFRDYNLFYFAETDGLFSGTSVRGVFSYVNAPRLIWVTDWRILGANYGVDLIVPFGYREVEYLWFTNFPVNTFRVVKDSSFGLGDIQFEPLLLSWHTKQFDIAAGYAIWAPTGEFDANEFVNNGSGFWTHMLTAGATWYVDEEKTWAVGLLNRYEINHEQEDTGITPGHTLTMEWGLSKTVTKGIDLGIIGYWQQQVTESSGPGTSHSLAQVVGVGPEILAFCPRLGLFTSLRYVHELAADHRPEGHTVTLTLTKRF